MKSPTGGAPNPPLRITRFDRCLNLILNLNVDQICGGIQSLHFSADALPEPALSQRKNPESCFQASSTFLSFSRDIFSSTVTALNHHPMYMCHHRASAPITTTMQVLCAMNMYMYTKPLHATTTAPQPLYRNSPYCIRSMNP